MPPLYEQAEPSANVDYDIDEDHVVFTINGEIGLATNPDLTQQEKGQALDGPFLAMKQYVSDNQARKVSIDLTGTTYIDSGGVRWLFELAQHVRSQQGSLAIIAAEQSMVQRVLVLTALADIVPLFSDREGCKDYHDRNPVRAQPAPAPTRLAPARRTAPPYSVGAAPGEYPAAPPDLMQVAQGHDLTVYKGEDAAGRTFFKVVGELDAYLAPLFEESVKIEPRPDRPNEKTTLVLDLSQASHIDSSGLRAILTAELTATDHGHKFVLRNPSRQAAILLEITGLTEHFAIEVDQKPESSE